MSEEFEIAYEGRCQCGSETLDWEWSSDEMFFCAECSCMKRHILTPQTAIVEVELNGDEAEVDEDVPEWYDE